MTRRRRCTAHRTARCKQANHVAIAGRRQSTAWEYSEHAMLGEAQLTAVLKSR